MPLWRRELLLMVAFMTPDSILPEAAKRYGVKSFVFIIINLVTGNPVRDSFHGDKYFH